MRKIIRTDAAEIPVRNNIVVCQCKEAFEPLFYLVLIISKLRNRHYIYLVTVFFYCAFVIVCHDDKIIAL